MRDGQIALEILHAGAAARSGGRGGRLLAVLVGQDVAEGDDGVFRIATRVAKDRIISHRRSRGPPRAQVS